MRCLPTDVKFVPCITPVAGTADDAGSVVDTKGFNRGCFVVHFGAIAAGAVTSIKVQQADAASNGTTLTSGADIEGSAQTVAADDDGNVFYYDFIPSERYVQLTIGKDGANSVLGGAICYLYNQSGQAPVTHGLGTGTGEGSGSVTGEIDTVVTEGTA
jgi:hypothetical protein